jgi:hypothetical protein
MGALRPLIPLVGINWLLPRRPTQQASAGEWREVLPPQDETPGSGLRKGPQACRNFFSSSPTAVLCCSPTTWKSAPAPSIPATTLRAVGPNPWNAAYVQPSRRPKDGRYGENPNRLQHYYQYQVILKPNRPRPAGALSRLALCHRHRSGKPRHPLCRGRLGKPHAGRLGAWLGSVVRWHGSQRSSPISAGRRHRLRPVAGELTYGLERLAMYVQGVDNVYDLNFNGREGR